MYYYKEFHEKLENGAQYCAAFYHSDKEALATEMVNEDLKRFFSILPI